MSCNSKGLRCANAARQNGIWGQMSGALNALGNWSTWKDVKNKDEALDRLAKVTSAYLGIKGIDSEGIKLSSKILAAIVAVHAAEQITGAVATSGMRLFARGTPVGKYGGVIIRKSPIVPAKAKAIGRVIGQRLTEADGYYFHDRGRTWHCQSLTFNVKGTPRTLTHIRSYSMPYREFFFDRPLTLDPKADRSVVGEDGQTRSVSVQQVIDVIKGYEDPDQIAGYIGYTNELENMIGLGGAKRALFAANWFLVDEFERDDPANNAHFVDYDALIHGRPPSRQAEGYYQPSRQGDKDWPSTQGSTGRSREIPVMPHRTPDFYGQNLFSSAGKRPVPRPIPGLEERKPPPSEVIREIYNTIVDRYEHPDTGQPVPLIVEKLVGGPTGKSLAEARYFEPGTGEWVRIDNGNVRERLARAVENGNMRLASDYWLK